MSNVKTINLLPTVFRTDTNKKFLNATVDQLVSSPELVRVNGYIGRQFAPTRKVNDDYVRESTKLRQNYQLEPSVVVKNKSDDTVFYGNYIDLLQQIEYLGGNISDHDRLFKNESYSYSGLFEFDKFVNFTQYYWVPDGPKPVDVFSSGTPITNTFTVTRDPGTQSYKFSVYGVEDNPQITLAHGGIYEFVVNQPGIPFWIQAEPGTSGILAGQPNNSSRDVLGVENNGVDVGTVIFRVPLPNAQDFYSQLVLSAVADFAITQNYRDIQNALLSTVISEYNGFDGITNNLEGKKLIFLNSIYEDQDFWTSRGILDFEPLDTVSFDNSSIVAPNLRHAIWTVTLVDNGSGDQVIRLVNPIQLGENEKVYVQSGDINSYKEYYLDLDQEWVTVPFSTAPRKFLYYQDADNEALAGQIKIVDPQTDFIDVDNEIIGRKNYTSPNGIAFTNGLKIKFDVNVIPASYADQEYYVEGVGRAIRLVPVESLIPEWPMDKRTGEFDTTTPDYVTINRSSLDKNAWSRTNRWFHIDVLQLTANVYQEVLDVPQSARAVRPIIEFEPDIQLFNHGSYGIDYIDILELNTITDTFSQVELAPAQSNESAVITVGSSILNLRPGQKIIFGKDQDPEVVKSVYLVDIINLNDGIAEIADYRVQLTKDTLTNIVSGTTLLSKETIEDSSILSGTYTQSGNAVRVTINNHGLSPGDNITIRVDSGSGYNGNYTIISIIDNNTFLFRDTTNPIQSTSGALAVRLAGINYQNWYNGTEWILPLRQQQKTVTNQEPLFDVVDDSGNSISDTSIYLKSTFKGTRIFSYRKGTGNKDAALGFPLSYRNFNNVGDIQFDNNFDNDVFVYQTGPLAASSTTKNINNYYLKQVDSQESFSLRNVWVKNTEETKQYQLFNYTFTGETNYFEIDIDPEQNDTQPNIIVYINNDTLSTNFYSIVSLFGRKAVRISINKLKVDDLVTIRIYSKQVSQIGFYEVPVNLDLNSVNSPFLTLTLGQLRNHLITLSHNTVPNLIQGTVPGVGNIRDLDIKRQGGSILQHASPVIYSNLFLLDNELNFDKSVELADREYSKFKNKFLELSVTRSELVDLNDIPASVDNLLKQINLVKNSQFPWYYSDMVPYGERTSDQYLILNPLSRSYELRSIFMDQKIGNRAVLVYYAVTEKDQYGNVLKDAKNNPIIKKKHQLIKDINYHFNVEYPSVIIKDTVNQIYNDLIIIEDFANTDGTFIPETPTKLGLYPKYQPQIYQDTTYLEPINVIQGHDGSIIPVFNDYRDDLLIELELRIFNNIKVSYNDTFINLLDYIPGKFRNSDYNLAEYNNALTTSFLKWVGNNKVDYSTNSAFDSNNSFTWNYKNFVDTIDGEKLPGSWRAVFKYFYDTDRPHTHPWEMLGFGIKPDWWEDRYGLGPYTGGNEVLWSDLSRGYIYGEDRVDERFIRTYTDPVTGSTRSLLDIIPVDDRGNLKSPEKILVKSFNSLKANTTWAVGDIGPAENAWRRSSSYPFAVQKALAVLIPGFYFGSQINLDNYSRNTNLDQYVLSDTLQRITANAIKINGRLPNGTIERTVGYINWVGDYLTNLGIDPASKIKDYFAGLSLRLSYKAAGFTDKNYINVLAEQSSPTSTNESIVIPTENYEVFLNKSTTISKINYSAVILKRTDNGWSVTGYDNENPYFDIVPSLANNNYATIGSGDVVGIVYQDFQNFKVRIPYGFEFNSRQQVVDFLISYGRYLVGKGFVFGNFNNILEKQLDWNLSAEEFLTWSQQGWAVGTVLILSPVINEVSINSTVGTVDFLANLVDGSKILDQNFNVINNTEFSIIRYGPEFKVTVLGPATIGLITLNLVQFEHSLIFDNTTLFNDVIYRPELGNRQYRLKLVGSRTGSWNGQMDIPGFIWNPGTIDDWRPGVDYQKGSLVIYKNTYYVALQNVIAATDFNAQNWKQYNSKQFKTGLLPNFNFNAKVFDNVYDINDQPQNKQINKFSNGLIGFRERKYLTDLGLDVQTQSKFYQGFIKQKGTLNAVNALSSVQLSNLKSDLSIKEEWGIRVGEYGSIDSNDYLEFVLDEQVFNNDPSTFSLLAPGTSADDRIIGIGQNDLYRRPNAYHPNILSNQIYVDKDITQPITAGYLSLTDIDTTLYDLRNYSELDSVIANVGSGYKIWVAKDYTNNWNVYRVTETNNKTTRLTFSLDGLLLFTTEHPHGLTEGKIIAIKNFDDDFDGFYRIFGIKDNFSFFVVATKNLDLIQQIGEIDGNGLVFVLGSVRGNTAHDVIINQEPLNRWKANDRVFADNDAGTEEWAVWQKQDVWSSSGALPLISTDYVSSGGYGSVVKLNSAASLALAGCPNQNKVKVFNRNNDVWSQSSTYEPQVIPSTLPDGLEFGSSLAIGSNSIVIGAPAAGNNRGLAFVYKSYIKQIDNEPVVDNGVQILSIPEIIFGDGSRDGNEFGHSLSISQDDRWLYVGAPGDEKVYAYKLINVETQYHTFNITNTATLSYVLSFTPVSGNIESLQVKGRSRNYVPNIDFTYNAGTNTLTFNAISISLDEITVTETSYYNRITSITPDVAYQGRFGDSIHTTTDATQILISSPEANSNQGAVLVYDRMIETFVSTGNSTFTPNRTIPAAHYVEVNGVEQIEFVDYVVASDSVFLTQPAPAGAKVSIDIDQFNLIQVIGPEIAFSNSQFGKAIDFCFNNCSLYIGAPYYSDSNYRFGKVYRYVNQGRVWGTILGVIENPTVTAGDSIRINDIEVIFNGTTVTSVANDINEARIQGVTATVENNRLRIVSESTEKYARLRILPGYTNGANSPIEYLGLLVFGLTQELSRPESGINYFGTSIEISDDSETLLVSASGGISTRKLLIDSDDTTFDQNTTNFISKVKNTGTVYVFELISKNDSSFADPSKFSFVLELSASNFVDGTGFGDAISVANNYALIGASTDSATLSEAGEVYIFQNTTGNKSWSNIRSKQAKVDLKNLNRVFVYNKRNREIVANLDFYDPAKGKILGIAEQELDYISSFDPAKYNQRDFTLDVFQPQTAGDARRGPAGTPPTVGSVPGWGENQVGQLWWNLDAVRFVDYEQGSLIYRAKNWGSVFPGSQIQVCEWVKSDVPPGSYTGSGTALYVDNSRYAIDYKVDTTTGMVKTNYYYWVINKTTTDYFAAAKTRTAAEVANIIENPQTAGVPYIAALRTDTFNLHGVNSYITGTDAVLHIEYSLIDNDNIIHSEYNIISENSQDGQIPEKIINKINDSLVGKTVDGFVLPDPRLPETQKYGIATRPRQSLFKNRLLALKNVILFVNRVLASTDYPIAQTVNLSDFYQADPIPEEFTGEWDISVNAYEELDYVDKTLLPDGYKILVRNDTRYNELWTINQLTSNRSSFDIIKIQSYRTDFFVELVDWYQNNFDPTQQATFIVENYNEIQKLSLTPGDIIYVIDDGTSKYAYYQVESDLSLTVVGLQDGTIQIKNSLYETGAENDYFDTNEFDSSRFDLSPVEETRNILEAIHNSLFIGNLKDRFNTLFFTIINYLLTEQISTDWIFKSSFINVLHKIRKLDKFPNFVKDNQTYYLDYINEVKPYRTQIREYTLSYEGDDPYDGSITDFGLPPYWNGVSYASPTVSNLLDPEWLANIPESLQTDYSYWLNNYTYQVANVQIVDPGIEYTDEPTVAIFGGNGTGATARARIDAFGRISAIDVISPGSGFVTTPSVSINGIGFRDTGANISLSLFGNGAINSATVINSGQGITRVPDLIVVDILGTGANLSCTVANGSISTVTINNRGTGYTATARVSVREPGTSAKAVVKLRNIYFRPNLAQTEQSYNTVRNIYSTIKFDRISYTSNIQQWQSNTSYYLGDTVAYQGAAYRANTVQSWANVFYDSTSIVAYNGSTYVAANANSSISSLQVEAAGNVFIDPIVYDYDNTQTYLANAVIRFGDSLYINANSTANVSGMSYTFPVIGTILNPNVQPYSNTVSYTTQTPFSYDGNVWITANIYANATGVSYTFPNWSNLTPRAARLNANVVVWEPYTVYDTANVVVLVLGNIVIANTQVTNANLFAPNIQFFGNANVVPAVSSNLTISTGNIRQALSQEVTFNLGNVIAANSTYIFNSANARQVTANVTTWEPNKVYETNTILVSPYTPGEEYQTFVAANTNTSLTGTTFNFANAMPVNAAVLSQASLKLSGNVTLTANTWVGILNSTAIAEVKYDTTGNVVFVDSVHGTLNPGTGSWMYSVDVSTVPATFVSNLGVLVYRVTDIFDYNSYDRLLSTDFDNANDRTMAYYSPTSTMPPRELNRLFNGIDYPGVNVNSPYYDNRVTFTTSSIRFQSNTSTITTENIYDTNFNTLDLEVGQFITITGAGFVQNNGTFEISQISDNQIRLYGNILVDELAGNVISITYFNENDPFVLDTIIQSEYLDTALGTRPEDINVDGGRYVDTYSSHAPEELIPGRVFDNLNMEVYTRINSNTQVVGYRITQNMYANSASSNESLHPEYYRITESNIAVLTQDLNINDGNVYVDDATKLANPGSGPHGSPGIVYINGEKIKYFKNLIYEVVDWEPVIVVEDNLPYDFSVSPPLKTNTHPESANIRQSSSSVELVVYPEGSIVRYEGNIYKAIGNLTGITFNFSNATPFNANVLTQIQRGVDGTGVANIHLTGSNVADASLNQKITAANVHTTTWLNSSAVSRDTTGNLQFTYANLGLGYNSGTVSVTLSPAGTNGNTATVSNIYLYANGAIKALRIDNAGYGYTGNAVITVTGANTVPFVGNASISVTDGLGLEGSKTLVAEFIKGFNPY